MEPPEDLPFELDLMAQSMAKRLGLSMDDFWAILYRKKPRPPGWVETWTKTFASEGILTQQLTSVKVNSAVTDEHRFNIAKGQKRGDKFLAAITASEFTQKTLAERLKIAPALLSMYRKNKRPIPRERAEEIERLTGWKATLRNWPGGIVS